MTQITSKYHSDNILGWESGSAMPAAPANLYAALLTAMPTTNGGTGLVECSASGYVRQQITPAQWAAITTNADNVTEQSSTNADVVFPAMGAGVTVVGVALYDASAAGHWLRAATLTGGNATVPQGQTFTLQSGNVTRQSA